MDAQLCHSPGSNSGEGCGGVFSQKSSPGLCAKCQKLSTLREDSPEYTMWQVCLYIERMSVIVFAEFFLPEYEAMHWLWIGLEEYVW